MKIIEARNVCQALPQTIQYLLKEGRPENSRAGQVIVSPKPMLIVTKCPRERVLFCENRDANPFFHLAEAIWMLAGGHDTEFLDRFVHDFSERYGEENGTLHDAYGYRWRKMFGIDQLNIIVKRLLENPLDRQCVLQMWDASPNNGNDLIGNWKSRPCNTNVFVRMNGNELDLTICCRSNDMLWGAHGANAVHFSILQEYLAARIDANIGMMYQISNNAHIYLDQLEKAKSIILDDRYSYDIFPLAMFSAPEIIDDDLHRFMENMEKEDFEKDEYDNSWFSTTAMNAMKAHNLFKQKKYQEALETADEIDAPDWRVACYEWIYRRQ
jgi:thymidylate synthase